MPREPLNLRRRQQHSIATPDLPRPKAPMCGQPIPGSFWRCAAVLQLRRRPLVANTYSTFCPVCRKRGRLVVKP